MRIVALGTGMPSPRPKQAASCWLVELGNGDKFLFDLGAGCHERIAAQKIPYDYLDKVFISHLHVDHYGDLAGFWLGGTVMNRLTPLRVWGPNGPTPEFGTKYALDRSLAKPRLAVGYHFFNDFDTEPEVRTRIRKTYSGPLALAQDYMVFDVTKDDIRVRMSAIDEEVWPSPAQRKKLPPDTSKLIPFSDFTKSGALPMPEVVGQIFEEINEK